MMQFMLILSILVFSSQYVSALRILVVIPGVTKSHYLFNHRVIDVLHSAGHEVSDLVMHTNGYLPFKKPDHVAHHFELFPNSTETPSWSASIDRANELMQNYVYGTIRFPKFVRAALTYREHARESCKELVGAGSVILPQLRKIKFDLILAHSLTMCPVGLAKILDAPLAWVSGGTYIIDAIGFYLTLPLPSSYVSNIAMPFGDKMIFRERARNFVTISFMYTLLNSLIYLRPEMTENPSFYEHLEDPDENLDTLGRTVENLFLNGEKIIDFPRPLTSSIHYVGELATNTYGKPLTDEWENFLTGSHDGIILFSLGSVADTNEMPISWRTAFFEAFKEFPNYRIIWKFEPKVPDAEKYPHIRLTNWVPQREILGHDRLQLFITHGGYNSLLESCHSGAPLLLLPLFLDQPGNALRATKLGIARVLNKNSLTKEGIVAEMREMLSNPSYKTRANFVSSVIEEQLVSNQKLLLHKIKRAGMSNIHPSWNHTLYAARRLNILQYYSIDVIAFMLSVLIVTASTATYIMYKIMLEI